MRASVGMGMMSAAFGQRLRRLAPYALTTPSLLLHPPLQQFERILNGKLRPEGESKLTKRCDSWAKALESGASMWGPDAAQSMHALHLYSAQNFPAMLHRAFSTKPIGAQEHKLKTTERGERGGRERARGAWTRAADDTVEIDTEMVLDLIQSRDEARRIRDYETADDIIAVLQEDWGVVVDDDLREWWVGDRKDRKANRERGGDKVPFSQPSFKAFAESRMSLVDDNDDDDDDDDTTPRARPPSLRSRLSLRSPEAGRERGGRERGGGSWTRAADDNDTAEIDEEMVWNLIESRDEARRGRDYATSDDIRAVLQEDWGVAVDDDLREWWVGDRKDNRDRKFVGRERGGRGGGPDWAGDNKVPFSRAFKRAEGDAAEVDAGAVEELIREREDARKSRDYKTADGLRDELVRNFGVNVDDGEREWWVGGRKGNRVRKERERERVREEREVRLTNFLVERERREKGILVERERREGRGDRGGGRGGRGGGSGSGAYRSRDGGGREYISVEDFGWS